MRTAIALLLATTLSCRTTSLPHPSDQAARDIDRFVEQTVREIPGLPGVGIAIVRDGKPYYARGFGFANIEKRTVPDAQTGYYIGSTTKAYTGLAVAILANRGQLDLDAPITKYLPEVKMAPPLDAEKLTLRKFLTHTSGIENDAIVFRTAFTGEHTPAGLISLLSTSKPGKEGFRYDNLGYVVASLIIERVTGRPWQKVLDELVFTPLGMNHTTAYMSEAIRSPCASPYTMNRSAELELLTYVKNDRMMHAAGGIVTTPADLIRWLEANINEGRIGGRQVIPAAAFREIQRKQVDAAVTRVRFKANGYGFGWYQAEYDGDKLLFHQGGFPGWLSNFSFMPEKRIGVAIVTNSDGPSVALNEIATYVYDRLLRETDAGRSSAELLAKLKASVQQQRERFLAEVDKRSKRPWMLRHANQAYVGTYESPWYGTLRIEQRGDKLYASLAQLSTVVEAFTEPESARVEMVPGSGEVLRFTFGNGDTADSVKWGEDVFQRVR
ncbi:MAG: serine hydrolase [Thermoanaerobaculia bacterium]